MLTRVRLEGPSTCFIVDHKELAIVPCMCNAPSAPSRHRARSFFRIVAPLLSHVLHFEIETLPTTVPTVRCEVMLDDVRGTVLF